MRMRKQTSPVLWVIMWLRRMRTNGRNIVTWWLNWWTLCKAQHCGVSRKTSLGKLYCGATPSIHEIILDEHDRHAMLTLHHQMYPENRVLEVDCFGMTCKRVTHFNVTYSTEGSWAEWSAYVFAKWCANTNSFEEPIIDPLSEPRPAITKQFLLVNVLSKGAAFKHVIAQVSWLQPHLERHFYGKPVEVWSLQGTDTSHPVSFLLFLLNELLEDVWSTHPLCS